MMFENMAWGKVLPKSGNGEFLAPDLAADPTVFS